MGPVNRLPSTPASDLFIIATICVILQRELPFMELEDDHNRRYIIRHDDGLDLDYFHLFYSKYTVGRVLVSEGRGCWWWSIWIPLPLPLLLELCNWDQKAPVSSRHDSWGRLLLKPYVETQSHNLLTITQARMIEDPIQDNTSSSPTQASFFNRLSIGIKWKDYG